jgi:hypothetical protein
MDVGQRGERGQLYASDRTHSRGKSKIRGDAEYHRMMVAKHWAKRKK